MSMCPYCDHVFTREEEEALEPCPVCNDGENLEPREESSVVCSHCGAPCGWAPEGTENAVCADCEDSLVSLAACSDCGEMFPVDDLDDDDHCSDCADDYFFECSGCGNKVRHDEECPTCSTECVVCGGFFVNGIVDDDGDFRCDSCVDDNDEEDEE